MELVAEGGETCDQASHLNHLGYHFAQGYLYSKPVPLEQFEEMKRGSLANERIRSEAALPQYGGHSCAG